MSARGKQNRKSHRFQPWHRFAENHHAIRQAMFKHFLLHLQYAFGAWDAVLSRIDFACHSDGSCSCLKNSFCNVVRVASVMEQDMQVAHCVCSKTLPKILNQLTIELADLGGRHFCFKNKVRPTTKVDGAGNQSFFHRKNHMAITSDSGLVPKAFSYCLAQADPNIFRSMMGVYLKIADRCNLQIDQCMLGQQDKHMIQESNSCLNFILAASIQTKMEADVRLCRLARDRAGSFQCHIRFLMLLAVFRSKRQDFSRPMRAFR